MPYVEGWYDYYDDDPADADGTCYLDLLPNPRSTDAENDDLSDFDGAHFVGGMHFASLGGPLTIRESAICSNDGLVAFEENGVIRNATRIDQGYVVYVDSSNDLENRVIELGFVGMKDPGSLITDEFLPVGGSGAPTGVRFRGGNYFWDEVDETQAFRPYKLIPDNEFGRTVASMRSLSTGGSSPFRDELAEVLFSAPQAFKGRGAIMVTFGTDLIGFGDQDVKSYPFNGRGVTRPEGRFMLGAVHGDELGYASDAGDLNGDLVGDILCGAPGADRNGRVDSGIVYIIFGRVDLPHFDLSLANPPRVELHGDQSNQRFGAIQTLVGNVDNDSFPDDIGFASPYAGADGPGGVESGFVGILLARNQITGENILSVSDVGTPSLEGTRIYGHQPGGHAGTIINGGGDFNGDRRDDLIIVAPDETRVVNGTLRRGVAYVIYGGSHLINLTFDTSQIGTTVPGAVLVSPYTVGSADEAPITWAGFAGDVNADGADDILVGLETADYVDPRNPSQRRIDAGECYLIYGSK